MESYIIVLTVIYISQIIIFIVYDWLTLKKYNKRISLHNILIGDKFVPSMLFEGTCKVSKINKDSILYTMFPMYARRFIYMHLYTKGQMCDYYSTVKAVYIFGALKFIPIFPIFSLLCDISMEIIGFIIEH